MKLRTLPDWYSYISPKDLYCWTGEEINSNLISKKICFGILINKNQKLFVNKATKSISLSDNLYLSLKQLNQWDEDSIEKINSHIILFSFEIEEYYWNFGVLELRFNNLTTGLPNVYEDFQDYEITDKYNLIENEIQ